MKNGGSHVGTSKRAELMSNTKEPQPRSLKMLCDTNKIESDQQIVKKILTNEAELDLRRSTLSKFYSKLHSLFSPFDFRLATIKESVFFNEDWYINTYKDVAESGMDPAQHYLDFGSMEGRDPGPFFSTRDYQNSNPACTEFNINPLIHRKKKNWRKPWWIKSPLDQNKLSSADRAAIIKHIASFEFRPLISVVMPVYNTPEKYLRNAIETIQAQIYPNWEICIADDASTDVRVRQILKEYADKDQRISVIYREKNGNISAATNSALDLAKGEFIALMDHDDLMHETALYEVSAEINLHRDVDLIFTDEDQADEKGRRLGGYHKPDFNPELFLGQNMVNHLGVYRRSLVKKLGGMRLGFEGSQDYDLALRIWASTKIENIRHIPIVLYHWRRGTQSGSYSESQLEKCIAAARKAIQEYLDKESEGAIVVPAPIMPGFSRVIRKIPEPAPLVSIIVPTKDQADLLSVCAKGILSHTDYPNIELIIVDHESRELITHDLLSLLSQDSRVKILRYQGAFNYSEMNNLAVKSAKGEILALLNNDIEILETTWLTEMVSHAVRPEIGAVGAKLLYPDRRVQHAGVIIGINDYAGHAFHFQKEDAFGYQGQAVLTRAVSAVTGACLVVRKSAYVEVGGLNSERLGVAVNDVDFCLKIQNMGYRNIWTPFAKLLHHESVSRGAENTPHKLRRFNKELEYFKFEWSKIIQNDPFYNPNLSLRSLDYSKARTTRRPKTWNKYLN
jgi:O-antigen biosynthesis protein